MVGLARENSTGKILSAVIIVAILSAVVALGYVIATPRAGERFTEFYLLDLGSKIQNYPSELKVREEGKVVVGIINREQRAVSYRVEVKIAEVKKNKLGPITLDYNEKYEEMVSFSLDQPGISQKVEFLLYKDEGGEPYLTLYLLVNVRE